MFVPEKVVREKKPEQVDEVMKGKTEKVGEVMKGKLEKVREVMKKEKPRFQDMPVGKGGEESSKRDDSLDLDIAKALNKKKEERKLKEVPEVDDRHNGTKRRQERENEETLAERERESRRRERENEETLAERERERRRREREKERTRQDGTEI